MNWRNPFLITYLSVTVVGTGILGFLLYTGSAHYAEVSTNYDDALLKLRKLQNRTPFPSAENNNKYVEYTKEYRAEYDKLAAKVATMQVSVEDITPQAFQDRLRANVSQVEEAARQNSVQLSSDFYLGFDQYRGTLPADSAAGPLARELAAIRLIVDNLIQLKANKIVGIKRDLLPEEGGASSAAPEPQPSQNRRPGGQRPNGGDNSSHVVTSNSFEIVFESNQSTMRSSLDYIANADQFFIIRYLNVENSGIKEPPKRVDPKAAAAPPPVGGDAGAPAAPQSTLRVLVGHETLTVALRVEMITFNNLTSRK